MRACGHEVEKPEIDTVPGVASEVRDQALLETAARGALASGRLVRAQGLFARLLAASQARQAVRAVALAGLAQVHERLGDTDGALLLARRVAEAEGLPDVAAAAARLVLARWHAGRADLAQMARELDQVPGSAHGQAVEAAVEAFLDWHEVDLARRALDRWGEVPSLAKARYWLASGDTDRARTAALATVGGDRRCASLLVLSAVALHDGATGSALALARRAATEARARGDGPTIGQARLGAARALLAAGRHEEARRAARAALAVARRQAHLGRQIEARLLLASVHEARDEIATALAHADAAALLVDRTRPTVLGLEALLTAVRLAFLARGRPERSLLETLDRHVDERLQGSGLPAGAALLWAGVELWRGRKEAASALLDRLENPSADHGPEMPVEATAELALRLDRPDLTLRLLACGPSSVRGGDRGRMLAAIALRRQGRAEQALALVESLKRSIVQERLREVILSDTGHPGAAAAERESWQASVRRGEASFAQLEALGLGGPRTMVLEVGEVRRGVSLEEAEVQLPGPDLEIVVDLTRPRVFLAPDGPVDLRDRPVTIAALRLLAEEAGRPLSRAEFYSRLWHTPFDAEIHEPKVLKTLQRLRVLLGVSSDGQPRIVFGAASGIRLARADRVGMLMSRARARWGALSRRQRRILDLLDAGGGLFSLEEIGRTCHTGRTTVSSDLRELVGRGLVERVGRARATRYRRSAGGAVEVA